MNSGVSAPEYIRVKRRRDEDSIQALLLEEQRNAKKGKFVFKLARTVEANNSETDTPLLKLCNENDRLVYVLEQEKEKVQNDKDALPNSIMEMLDDYLKLKDNDPQETKKRKSSRKHSIPVNVALMPSADYVYDVYVRETIPEDEFVFDKNTVGYIRIVETSGDLIPEEDEDPEKTLLTDDEDSNEEDYYQNDYPEDEDDDRSILIGSEENSSEQENVVFLDEVDEQLIGNESEDDNDEFETLFQNYGNTPNLLSSLNSHNYVDLDYDEDQADSMSDNNNPEEFERHIFFASDETDETAINRDRIFGKLQKMIDRS